MAEEKCPDCRTQKLDYTLDYCEAVCKQCGYAIHDFTQKNQLHHQKERTRETTDNQSSTKKNWGDLCTVNNSTEYNIKKALKILEDFSQQLNLSSETRKQAAEIYSNSVSKNLTDGLSREKIIASIVYISAKQNQKPITLKQAAQLSNTDKTTIDHISRKLQRHLQIKTPICQPTDYIPKISLSLNLNEEQKEKISDLLCKAEKQEVKTTNSPVGYVAAAIYLTTTDETQSDLSFKIGVCRETIRQRINELQQLTEPQNHTG